MTRLVMGFLGLALIGAGEARADITRLTGRVVDAAGKPIAGAEVGTVWMFDGDRPQAFDGVKADADGRFRMDHNFNGRPGALVAMDADRKVGGLAIVDPAKVPESVEISAGSLVRVHGGFACPELGEPLGWTNVYMMVEPGRIRVAQCSSRESKFDLKLPAGKYLFNGYGSKEVKQVGRRVELKSDQPDLDLGSIALEVAPLGKMYDKEPPPLHVTDARGIGKDVKLADLKGKWVVLDFWGYWCGPCVGRSLPDLMQIWDEHPEDRDKFVVLAFHDKQAENFAQLDEKLKPIVASIWGGRELPFPILLDATGKTVEEYGIRAWPTTILINPEGKVVRGGEHALRKALPEVPIARRIPLALDRSVGFGIEDSIGLAEFARFAGQVGNIPIALDESALHSAGVARDAKIPLATSAQVSLRSWLDLALRPLGLVAVPGPEGLVVTAATPGVAVAPSPVQARVNAAIERKLAESKASFDFRDRTLAEITAHFEEETRETFVVDPADRLAGRLDLKTTVSGQAADLPLRDALKVLLGPAGIEAVVRDEVVVLTRKAAP